MAPRVSDSNCIEHGAGDDRHRGDLSPTIVTDVAAHSFNTDVPMQNVIKPFREAEARCRALLESSNNSSNRPTESSSAAKLGISEELETISRLKEEGLLSEGEFAAAEAKIIGSSLDCVIPGLDNPSENCVELLKS